MTFVDTEDWLAFAIPESIRYKKLKASTNGGAHYCDVGEDLSAL